MALTKTDQEHIAGMLLTLIELLEITGLDEEEISYVTKSGTEYTLKESLIYVDTLLGLSDETISTIQ